MFFYVYLLILSDKSWYIGFSEDLYQRVRDHRAGRVKSTTNKRPLKLVYYEAYLNKKDALGRERFLKSGSGRKYLKKQLRNYLQKK